MAAVLDDFARRHGLEVHHGVPLTTRQGRRGDLDHVLVVGARTPYIVAIETKAEQPAPGHFEQVEANARRASRRYFGGAPQYRIVVHPNSGEAPEFDSLRMAVRLGLPRLPGYLAEVLRGEHRHRLAA